MHETGVLYIVATPIGNLDDITYRAVDVLKQVDLVAAEDTRHSQRLLSHLGVKAALKSYHDHNEESQASVLLDLLQQGKTIALISDAGTPLINDPGYRIVQAAHNAGIKVVPVPGANAAVAALSSCGLAVNRFAFEGFPPAKSGQRKSYFESLVQSPYTLVFYESSHRILDCLNDAVEIFGAEREAAMARELTKTFETIRRGSLDELRAFVKGDANQQKGEFVLVIAAASENQDDDQEIHELLNRLMPILSVKQASQVIAELYGYKKNRVYQLALEKQKSD